MWHAFGVLNRPCSDGTLSNTTRYLRAHAVVTASRKIKARIHIEDVHVSESESYPERRQSHQVSHTKVKHG